MTKSIGALSLNKKVSSMHFYLFIFNRLVLGNTICKKIHWKKSGHLEPNILKHTLLWQKLQSSTNKLFISQLLLCPLFLQEKHSWCRLWVVLMEKLGPVAETELSVPDIAYIFTYQKVTQLVLTVLDITAFVCADKKESKWTKPKIIW